MTDETCACERCDCSTRRDSAVERDGQRFCCPACADHHPNGEPCESSGCHCEKIGEEKLDDALEETFPASDPISP
ncbi:metallothionein [Pseudomonas sp. CDFA 602]|uniref:metallothionein n=1 Tax=Pseudomonas californiensis TaxID=2829823 RepID=UPI001E2A245C|nr:metallothionein [Pseudomonas californiensis]MCD5994059.1 metallothionein [Pseudomonas californiensis]MCD5999842.1 metallothionein [Pseudomonas californiensis]